MGLGVIDSNCKQDRMTDTENSPHFVLYYSTGEVGEGGEGPVAQEGEGFCEGDTIVVSHDIATGSIGWEIN